MALYSPIVKNSYAPLTAIVPRKNAASAHAHTTSQVIIGSDLLVFLVMVIALPQFASWGC